MYCQVYLGEEEVELDVEVFFDYSAGQAQTYWEPAEDDELTVFSIMFEGREIVELVHESEIERLVQLGFKDAYADRCADLHDDFYDNNRGF